MVDKHFWDFQIYPETKELEDGNYGEKFFTKRMKKEGYLARCLKGEVKKNNNNKK